MFFFRFWTWKLNFCEFRFLGVGENRERSVSLNNCTCINFSFLFQHRCRCWCGLHCQLGGCGCCGKYRRHQRSRGCSFAAVQRGCWRGLRRLDSWGRGSRGCCGWQLRLSTIRWSQRRVAHASQAEGNECFGVLKH
jgi:hypothetical protein